VGQSSTADDQAYRACIWIEGAPQDLNQFIPSNSGWELEVAHATNERGQIVGAGKHNGRRHAFLITPVQ
jgi:hypothetical protein